MTLLFKYLLCFNNIFTILSNRIHELKEKTIAVDMDLMFFFFFKITLRPLKKRLKALNLQVDMDLEAPYSPKSGTEHR